MQEYDNTPPVARDLSATYAPSNGAPTAKAIAGMTPDVTPPDAVAINQAPSNVAPTAVDLTAAYAVNNGAPTAKAIAGMTPDSTPPDAHALPGYQPSNGAPVAAPIANFSPNTDAPRLRGTLTPQPLTDDNVNTPILKIEGALALNQVYGQTRVPNACTVDRIQLQLAEPPVGGPATITLVDAGGVSYGAAVTVADGQTFGEAVINPPLQLLAASNVLGKATAIGVTQPGAFGTLTLFTKLAT